MIDIKIEVEDHIIKKNNRPIFFNRATHVPIIGKSQQLKNAEQYLELMFRSEKNKKQIETITTYVSVKYVFYFARKNSRKFKVCDLSNLFEIVSDALQQSEIIKNDNLIQSFDGSRKIQTDEDKNTLYIQISEFLEEIEPPVKQTALKLE